MNIVWIITQLTIRETQRRRILWVGLLMGLGFLLLFGLGFHYIYLDISETNLRQSETDIIIGLLLTAGLYAVNFLAAIMAVLISVTTISGEIDNHTIETILTKPIYRWQVVLGKWLGYAIMSSLYVILLAGGLMLIVYLRAGVALHNVPFGLGLMILQVLIILSVTIAGGTRLSTLANGVMAFMLFGIAFLGGMVEQIGSLLTNETAVNIGIVSSLIIPTDIMWKYALALFQPQFLNTPFLAGPFAVTSQPSRAMLIYAVLYPIACLVFAVYSFTRRDL